MAEHYVDFLVRVVVPDAPDGLDLEDHVRDVNCMADLDGFGNLQIEIKDVQYCGVKLESGAVQRPDGQTGCNTKIAGDHSDFPSSNKEEDDAGSDPTVCAVCGFSLVQGNCIHCDRPV